jgi:transposase-like protein
MDMERRISSSEAARRIGVRTNTLARWRSLGKGPKGAIRLSETHVVYAVEAVDAFLRERKEAGRFLGKLTPGARAAKVA